MDRAIQSADWLDGEAGAGGTNWNAKIAAAADALRQQHGEIDRLRAELAGSQSDRQREHDLRVRIAGDAEALRSIMSVLCDSAKDVIQWSDDTGHDCYQMHRLSAAIDAALSGKEGV